MTRPHNLDRAAEYLGKQPGTVAMLLSQDDQILRFRGYRSWPGIDTIARDLLAAEPGTVYVVRAGQDGGPGDSEALESLRLTFGPIGPVALWRLHNGSLTVIPRDPLYGQMAGHREWTACEERSRRFALDLFPQLRTLETH